MLLSKVDLMSGIVGRLHKFTKGFTIMAFAEEGGQQQVAEGEGKADQNTPKQQVNFEDLIAKARSDEKKKLYGKITDLEASVATLTEKNNNLLLKVGELEQQLDEEKAKLTQVSKGDSEEVKTLKAEVDSLNNELESTKNELQSFKDKPPVNREDVEKEVRAELEKEYEIRTYRAEKIAQYANDPTVLVELVTGETKEDIDATLEAALERSKEIKKSLGLNLDGTPDQRKKQDNLALGIPPVNPAVQQQGGTGSSEDIMKQLAEMDVKSPEYAKLRKELGL